MIPYVIGLDLSLNSTGVATADGLSNWVPPERRRAKGEVRTLVDNCARLDWLEYQLHALVSQVRAEHTGPILAVIEDYAYSAKGSAVHGIAEWGGVARLALFKREILTTVVAPNVLKLYGTGRSGASKEEVVSAVTHRAGILFEGPGANDRADAWVLRQLGIARYLGDTDPPSDFVQMPKAHLKALDGVIWPAL